MQSFPKQTSKEQIQEENVMNKVILMGRLTRDPDVRYSTGENPLAIDRLRRRGGNERKWMLKR